MWLLLAALAAGHPLARSAARANPTLITNVAILSTTGEVGPRRDVVLRDGLIAAITPVGQDWSDDPITVVDGSGQTLLPGFVDAHVHFGSVLAVPHRLRLPNQRQNAEAFLYAGVTTALDLSLPGPAARRINARAAKGRWSGPTVIGAGRPFTAPHGHPISSARAVFRGPLVRAAAAHMAWQVSTSDDVDHAFSVRGDSPFVKVMLDALPPGSPTLSDEALERIRTGASAFGERLIAHVGTPNDVDRALALPVDALAHAPSHGRLSDAQIASLARAHIPVTPTLAVWDAISGVHRHTASVPPLAEEIMTRRQGRDRARVSAGKNDFRPPMQAYAATVADADAVRLETARRLFDGGVSVLVGSDSPNVNLPPGAALHRELDLLREAGLPSAAVLAAVTWGNSRFIDPDATFGAVRVGWQADLVLVDGDPSRDWDAVHRLVAVWTDGRAVTRRAR